VLIGSGRVRPKRIEPHCAVVGPGKGSTTATNVVVVVVVGFLLLSDFQSTKTFPFLNRSQLNFGY